MNQGTTASSSRESCSLLASATEDEIIVSQILVDLKNLMSLSESLANFNWICKRRRSCLNAAPPLQGASSWPSPSTDNEIPERRRAHIKAEEVTAQEEKHGGAARTTASPDTPLSFSPSDESDEKSKHSSKKTSKKRSREEYLDIIEELAQRKDLLRGEIENVKKYYNKLKAYNSQLKSIKQEVINSSVRKGETQMEISGVNLGMELTQHYRVHILPHPQPFTADPTAQELQCSYGPITAHSQPSDNGLGSVNHVSPLGFDLNVPAEEAFFGVDQLQPLDVSRVLDDKRARFAEARRKRRGIIKTKSSKIGV